MENVLFASLNILTLTKGARFLIKYDFKAQITSLWRNPEAVSSSIKQKIAVGPVLSLEKRYAMFDQPRISFVSFFVDYGILWAIVSSSRTKIAGKKNVNASQILVLPCKKQS